MVQIHSLTNLGIESLADDQVNNGSLQNNDVDAATAAAAAAALGVARPESNELNTLANIPMENMGSHNGNTQSVFKLTVEKPNGDMFKCHICSNLFTRKHNLKAHLLTHTDRKPFKCEECMAQFRRHYDLKRHEKIHTREKPFFCTNCGKRFARADALSRHQSSSNGCFGNAEDEDDAIQGKNQRKLKRRKIAKKSEKSSINSESTSSTNASSVSGSSCMSTSSGRDNMEAATAANEDDESNFFVHHQLVSSTKLKDADGINTSSTINTIPTNQRTESSSTKPNSEGNIEERVINEDGNHGSGADSDGNHNNNNNNNSNNSTSNNNIDDDDDDDDEAEEDDDRVNGIDGYERGIDFSSATALLNELKTHSTVGSDGNISIQLSQESFKSLKNILETLQELDSRVSQIHALTDAK